MSVAMDLASDQMFQAEVMDSPGTLQGAQAGTAHVCVWAFVHAGVAFGGHVCACVWGGLPAHGHCHQKGRRCRTAKRAR